MGRASGRSTGRSTGNGSRREPAPGRSSSLDAERRRTAALYAEEVAFHAAGAAAVAGLDEVGRGCLAGPVFAGAAILDAGDPILGLDDSKALAPGIREDLARTIFRRARAVAIGEASAGEIDALGIVEATRLAMRRALRALDAAFTPDALLLDAFELPGAGKRQRALVRGDARVACIAAASIVAKVARDERMERLDRDLPHYGFARHRGYGTPEHLEALRRHGPSSEHRLTFDRVLPGRAAA